MPKQSNVRSVPASRRRRTAGALPLQKMTFQLDAAIAKAIRDAVKSGEAPSANVFVEDAVRERLRTRRQARVYSAYSNAARDPAFLEEMQALDGSFDITLGDDTR
jgi:Arc/MetJ-type ribon-helix-helix transcriptional regulator